jgi:hypothetical protein
MDNDVQGSFPDILGSENKHVFGKTNAQEPEFLGLDTSIFELLADKIRTPKNKQKPC